jgi:hypothetical protein
MKLDCEEEPSEKTLTKEVVGTTFSVYVHMLRVKSSSAREVYHTMGMSSPWLASYHLDKLHKLKLAKKDPNGVYHANPKHFGILRSFIVTGEWIVPRTLFYALFFLAASVFFLFSLPRNLNITIFVFSLIPLTLIIIETILFYRALTKS